MLDGLAMSTLLYHNIDYIINPIKLSKYLFNLRHLIKYVLLCLAVIGYTIYIILHKLLYYQSRLKRKVSHLCYLHLVYR